MPKIDYPYVMAWNLFMGARKPYIQDQIKLAKEEHAPLDATYRDSSGTWHTFSQLDDSTSTRHEVAQYAAPYLKD